MAKDYVVKFAGDTGDLTTKIEDIRERFDKITQSTAPLKRQLKDLQAIMAEMNMKGLSNTEEFAKIAQYAGQVKDAISDAGKAVGEFASDTQALDAVASAFQGLTGGITLLTGAMNMFGGESEEVQQAILKVQSAIAMLNGVQAIANTLNKDSALMLALKSIGLGTNATATAANTTAEVANTAAEVTNTTATVANTAAETANAAAQTANTAATEAATVAQEANNAAVMANPYVLAAAAIAGLVAGIIAWISSMDDATDSEAALEAATDALCDAMDSEMKNVGSSINLYNKLKKQYNESGKKVDEFAKKIINNKEAQKKLGVVVKTVDDVHRLFANNTNAYQRAAIARGNALAAESAQAALLGSTLSELTKVYAKFKSGQEVNWRDMRKIIQNAGYTAEAADQMMHFAGFQYDDSGLLFGYGDLAGDGSLERLLDYVTRGGAFKVLEQLGQKFQQTFEDVNIADFNGMLTDNINVLNDAENAATRTGRAAANAGSNASRTTRENTKLTKEQKDEIAKVLTTLQGCDAIIKDAQADMKKLDNTSATYVADMQKLRNVIMGARVAKLNLIDKDSIQGLAEYKKVVQEIINDYPQGQAGLERWQQEMLKINEEAYKMANAMSQSGSLDDLKKIQSAIQTIINSLPAGSSEFEKWQNLLRNTLEKSYDIAKAMSTSESLDDLKKVQSAVTAIINSLPASSDEFEKWGNILKEVNDKIAAAQQKVDYATNGIQTGSLRAKQDELKKLQERLTNENLTVDVRLQLSKDSKKLQREINEMTNNVAEGSIKYLQDEVAELQEQLSNADLTIGERIELNTKIDQLQREIDEKTKGELTIKAEIVPTYTKKGDVYDQRQSYENANARISKIQEDLERGVIKSRKEAIAEIQDLNAQLMAMKLKPIVVHIETDFEKIVDGINEGLNGLSSITGLADSFDTLTEKLKEGADAWDLFKSAITATESVLNTISSVIRTVTEIQEMFNLTKGVTAAVNKTEAESTTEAAAGNIAKSATDTEAAVAAQTSTLALKAQEAAYLDMAAAAIFAAHASIPFAGVAIATGQIGTMMAAMTAQHTAALTLAAFAEGGIVGGNSIYGDRILARVNSGEMILNKRQQANLFNAINNGMLGGRQEITWRIKGSDLYGILKNYNNIKSKTGKAIW